MKFSMYATIGMLVTLSAFGPEFSGPELRADDVKPAAAATGIEAQPAPSPVDSKAARLVPGRTRLLAARLVDQTDIHAELVQVNEWLLHPSEEIRLSGNVFAIEDVISGEGTVYFKEAPLPEARTKPSTWDLSIGRNGELKLNTSDAYPWLTSKYSGGSWGRIKAFQALQRQVRPYNPKQDGLFLTNTWGDRNRDAQLNVPFILREIDAAAHLGADVVQLDDGWQKGMSANSHRAQGGGGAWNGFWAADPQFWEPNPERFPEGLEPLVQAAKAKGVEIGLWFAPDSSNGAANWERDAQALLKLYRTYGIRFFKVDALKITTPESEDNFRSLMDKVWKESDGNISFDFDITAERRFGYCDLMKPGRIFVENRYTDFGNYWPHQTLRTVWQLSHWIDPVRLRIEWLNNSRNTAKYGDNPLAPSRYKLDTLFAMTMMGSPLGWFETQHLPQQDLAQVSTLIAKWREHRQKMQQGGILPIGEAPDGNTWTGFVSVPSSGTEAYALLFRELNPESTYTLKMPQFNSTWNKAEVLGGRGKATLKDGSLSVQIDQKLDFLWVKLGN